MPGVPDYGLRARVRRACVLPQNIWLSHNELGRRLGCSRHTVTTVRMGLVADGLLPATLYNYMPGAVVRTGYVRGRRGESVRN